MNNTAGFKHFRLYSDSTLRSWKKEELIDYIHMLYHNWSVTDEAYLNVMELAKKMSDKATFKKPIFVDSRFRQRGKLNGQCVTLEYCYKCPNCNSHIFYDYDMSRYCGYCGQALDWNEKKRIMREEKQ